MEEEDGLGGEWMPVHVHSCINSISDADLSVCLHVKFSFSETKERTREALMLQKCICVSGPKTL